MNSHDEQVRAVVADQAGEWFVVNGEGPLDAQDAAALEAWFRTSPVNIEEFLGVADVARELKEVRENPHYSLEAILARARVEDEAPARRLWPSRHDTPRGRPVRRWLPVAVAVAACTVLGLGLLLRISVRSADPTAAADGTTVVHFETRHGELLTRRLADNSVLHLNTDSAVSIRYSKNERFVVLTSGEATFEVAHEPSRGFRVHAGAADITDLGTRFDVRLDATSTVVTVVEGRVTVGPNEPGQSRQASPVELGADQQIRVAEGSWPVAPVATDAKRTTAWLHRQIAFDNEPLERVAAEFNRYTDKQIQIETPALRTLRISGTFATDDIGAFIAFLRSLKGVRVDVTDTTIRVFRE